MVYASPDYMLRKQLWSDLDQVSLNIEGAWIATGDFNSVLTVDKISCPGNWSAFKSSAFQDWIFQQGLIDVGYVGSKFNWTRGTQDISFKGARLDRALCNFEWNCLFPHVTVTHLPKVKSDHSPILINCDNSVNAQGSKPFRFQATWLTHPGFKEVIVSA